MASSGLSNDGLERLHHVLRGHVERGDVPGMVALVSRGSDVHVETLGSLAAGESPPMRRDSLFRIASLTKIVTAVAAMILVEDCLIRLDDSIEPWIPELARRRVLRSIESPIDDTVPAARAITVRDLLSYRMGFGSVMAMPGTYPIQDYIRDYRIGGDGPPRPSQQLPADEWIAKLGELPLIAQPGERWLYHVSGDVLGVLIARVSGQSLGEFLRDRIFEPLGMRDTGFLAHPDQRSRLTSAYSVNRRTRSLDLFDDAATSDWAAEPRFESGAGGLVSTIDDYFAFSRMLLDGGRYGGGHILSRASVRLMTSDQLTPAQRAGGEIFFGSSRSWGLGMAVDIARIEIYQTPGRFGWDGGTGTTAYVDPAEDMISILFTQRSMESPEPPKVFSDFWTTAYAAME